MNDEELRLNLKNAGLYSLDYLQKSSINWTEFLRSSSNHYSRDFIEQLLITAHYPNATAVMEKELWKSHHYKVNYGENGIAVFKDFNGEFFNEKALQAAEIKVYYDISQVHQIAGTTIVRWSLGDVDESIVLNTIRKSYSKADTKSLPIAVLTSLEAIITEVNRMLTTSEQDVEYKGVSEVDVQALKNAGIEFDCVVDSTGKNDYIIKYEKTNKQQVQEIIADPLNSSLRR